MLTQLSHVAQCDLNSHLINTVVVTVDMWKTCSKHLLIWLHLFLTGVIAAVFVTVLVVLALIAIYLYKHKGSYRTHEMMEEGEVDKALQEKADDSIEEKQEYLMWFAPTTDCYKEVIQFN